MIDVGVAGIAIPRLSRAEVSRFAREIVAAVRRRRAAPFEVNEISIAFVDDASMRGLNRRYRKKDRTTDVLTFAAEEPSSGLLGDIVICVDQARRQAREQGHSLATEVRYLLVHGVIHAFGYDHQTDDGEMNALELKVRSAVGL